MHAVPLHTMRQLTKPGELIVASGNRDTDKNELEGSIGAREAHGAARGSAPHQRRACATHLTGHGESANPSLSGLVA